ncbi:MAG TPA: NUDIX domain-containing protein [Actinophytocola sp.]|uniref:NUDIX hydrolase n=1 Tax=Actinophytocola sp. TaxID=1872138 RepID=UPI002DBFC308|nr:NUDIX domain-containing protein [Actinophytocola sp.]HEU5472244.1 NUDIX domain-containing protein [Actinophytocola sp.]
MPDTPAAAAVLRVGARVLLLDRNDRILLIHARDPDRPEHHWWELPGGGCDPGEPPTQTARRELAEETGILVEHIGPHLWDRETRFHYRGREHHRRESVYLARITDSAPTLRPRHTANEKAGLIEHRWWTQPDLAACRDKLLPPNLPALFADILRGTLRRPVLLLA